MKALLNDKCSFMQQLFRDVIYSVSNEDSEINSESHDLKEHETVKENSNSVAKELSSTDTKRLETVSNLNENTRIPQKVPSSKK